MSRTPSQLEHVESLIATTEADLAEARHAYRIAARGATPETIRERADFVSRMSRLLENLRVRHHELLEEELRA